MAEFTNIYDVFDDMRKYAREHPNATFLCADNQQAASYGWVAYEVIDGVERYKNWSISLSRLKEQYRQGRDHPDQLTRAVSRQEHLRLLVERARAQGPLPPVRTLWERLEDEG